MCGGGGGKAPKPAAKLPEAPTTPQVSQRATGTEKGRRRRAASASDTILTGPRGLSDTANTSQKTLLGT